MANETTSTSNATRQLSYVLGAEALPPNKADIVAVQVCNIDDIDGLPSFTKQYAVESDLAAASAATEGTEITTNVEQTYGSAISAVVVEGAAVKFNITDRNVELAFPGMSGIDELMQSGGFAQRLALLQGPVNKATGQCWEKVEADVVALTQGLSNSVGTSGVALSIDDLFSALFTFDSLEATNRNNAWLFTSRQMDHMRRAIAVTGGGLGGGVWFQQADASFLAASTLPKNGYKGTFMGRPIYQYSHSLRSLSDTNTNVNGALLSLGSGKPDEGGGDTLGAFGIVARGGPKVRMTYIAGKRGMDVVVSIEYVAVEVANNNGVRIKTAAAA